MLNLFAKHIRGFYWESLDKKFLNCSLVGYIGTHELSYIFLLFQSLPFPAVTLCNFNAIRYDALLDSNFTDLIDTVENQSKIIALKNIKQRVDEIVNCEE